jgi:hypothetical protein
LGYILEAEITNEKLADYLYKALQDRTFFPIPLSLDNEKKGETDNRWKVIKNMEIESDL